LGGQPRYDGVCHAQEEVGMMKWLKEFFTKPMKEYYCDCGALLMVGLSHDCAPGLRRKIKELEERLDHGR